MLPNPTERPSAPALERGADQWLPIAVFAALPTVGVIAGPSYAPMVFGLAIARLLAGLWQARRFPAIDRDLAWIALAFVGLCWLGVAWSIVPGRSWHGALQMTGIVAAALILLGGRPLADDVAGRLFPVLLVACLLGAAIVCIDTKQSYPLQAFITGRPPLWSATKYNRGVDYLVLIVWPVLAYVWLRFRWKAALPLAAGIAAALVLGSSAAGRVAGVTGVVVLVLALCVPRLVAAGLATGTALLAAGLPFMLRVLAERHTALVPYVKPSGIHRLEIWDYMTARVVEHPVRGWGLLSASAVPIHPEELSHYLYANSQGIYPHNQWLELWVETGALGAAFGLAFALLVLMRVRRLPETLRPFAYAAFTSAMTVSCLNFEVTTDSWWAALAASGLLFATLGRFVTARAVPGNIPSWSHFRSGS
jgi:exopolysaccharide production protein ExoQ